MPQASAAVSRREILNGGDDAPKPPANENGELEPGGSGTSLILIFLGGLYGEANLLVVAKAYQDATDFRLRHPDLRELVKSSTCSVANPMVV